MIDANHPKIDFRLYYKDFPIIYLLTCSLSMNLSCVDQAEVKETSRPLQSQLSE